MTHVMARKVVTRGGKPFQSKLAPYEAEVKKLKANGVSVRSIAEEIRVRHGLEISHNAVASTFAALSAIGGRQCSTSSPRQRGYDHAGYGKRGEGENVANVGMLPLPIPIHNLSSIALATEDWILATLGLATLAQWQH